MTQRERRRQRRSRRRTGSKFLLGLGVLAALVGIAALSFGIWVLNVAAEAPSIDKLRPAVKGANSVVFASDGSRLGYIQSDELRTPLPLKLIPKQFKDATIAIEDERFYEHNGVDVSAIVRAAVRNVEAGETREGGSTITQQLVRNLYITDPEDTLERKIEEAKLAEELEEKRTKKWILRQYLNTASYGSVNGRTAVGVEAASQTFFNKPAGELKLKEAALLAGLPQAPSQYNPLTDPDAALKRRNNVLSAMAKEGYISSSRAESIKPAGLGLEAGSKYSEIREPYVFDYVAENLIERYGVNTVRQGGLEIHTTIDPDVQETARQAIASRVASLGGPSGALVAIDPSNGHIVAMADSGDYSQQQYNLAAQGNRQPGSSIKALVLANALNQGIDPSSTYYSGSSPKTLTLDDGTTWTVNNAEGGGGGTMSLAQATTKSVNVVYAQLGLDVGPEKTAELAKKLGVESELDGIPAEAIGGLRVGVSPLDMASAYATFAAGGVHHKPTAITKVEHPAGKTDEFEKDEGRRVISDGVAYELTKILKTVITSGTGTSAEFGCPAAGKTGTTDDYTDAWFVGYTPDLSTAVWVGYPEARTSMGSGAFGGTYAAPIWQSFMSSVDTSCGDFSRPSSPASLTPFYSDQSTTGKGSENSSYDGGSSSSTGSASAPATTDGGGGGGYDPDLYAPGAGQGPAPRPSGGGGDG
jgi:penicillin-binding protein 1A